MVKGASYAQDRIAAREEPYKMTLFGKDTQDMEVMAAEFLPDGKQLYFVVADSRGAVRVLQYDPNPHDHRRHNPRHCRRPRSHPG